MNQYEASLARICLECSGISVLYEDNVPEKFVVPSLYFPAAEIFSAGSALNSYQTKYAVYAKVFAYTKREAGELAEKIVKGIIQRNCRFPVYNKDGTNSGTVIKLEAPASRIVDEGMAQVTLSYKIIRAFAKVRSPTVQSVGINKNFD
ncbi:MAG: hypothetical protein OSJ61_15635 [Lachnospiraceae bacterium]|nr:hypothetical protein [Lachnospiraceae bacterium]